MWVDAGLVFGEEHGVFHLADVVIEGTGAHQKTICPDAIGNLGGQISHHNRVLKGARSHFAHLSEQSLVGVREFEERHIRRKTESAFDDIH